MVRAVDAAIRAEGFKSWIGDLEALVKKGYKGNVDQGIQESDGFVLLVPDEGLPEDLKDEFEQARELNKLILLLTRQPLSPEQLGLSHSHSLQWIPLAYPGSSYGFQEIARLLTHSLTYVRLLARALAWERQNYANDRLLSPGDLQATRSRLSWIEANLGSDFAIQPVQQQFLEASRHSKRTDYFRGKPPDVFISYSSKDRDFVKKLAQYLKDKKLEVWIDWENIPIATNWRDEVNQGIRAAHTFLFVISPHSVWSEHCKWELDQARQCFRRVIPLCCDRNYPPQRLDTLGLSELSYVSFEELDFSTAAEKVVTAIRTDLQDVKAYNRLYGNAYEWHIQQRLPRLLMDAKEWQQTRVWLRTRQQTGNHPDGKTHLVPLHPLQTDYINASRQAIRSEHQQRLLLASFTMAGFVAALALVALARLAETQALVASLEEKIGLDGLITALQAGKRLEDNPYLPFIRRDLPLQATTALHHETLSVRELNRLDGHERAVFDVAFSPNGEMLVSTGEDRTIRPWKLAGPLTPALRGDKEEVLAVDYSPDGDFFVTGDADSTVRILSCDQVFITAHKADASPLREAIIKLRYDETLNHRPRYRDCTTVKVLQHPGRIIRVAVSPGGQYVASASFGGTVRLWSREDSFTTPAVLSHESNPVYGLDFNPAARELLASDRSGQVNVWSLTDGSPKDTFTANDLPIDVRFSQDGNLVAISGANGLLQLWDRETGSSLLLPGHEGDYTRVTFSPNNEYLASADTDGVIYLWDVTTLRDALQAGSLDNPKEPLEPKTLQGHQDAINAIQFSSDSRYLASASRDDTVRIWLTTDGALLDTIAGHQDEVLGVSFSSQIKSDPYDETEVGVAYLATSSRDGTVRIWRINNNVRPLPHENRIYDVAFRPDGKVLASGGRRNISLWRLSDQSRIAHISARLEGEIFSVHYAPADRRYLVAGDSTGAVSIWRPDINTREPHQRWVAVEEGEVSTVRFSPNGQMIASGGSDETIRFWSKNGKALGEYRLDQPIASLAFSPQGNRLVVATTPNTITTPPSGLNFSQLGRIQVFEVNQDLQGRITLDLIATPSSTQNPHKGGILTVAFNPINPNQLASGGEDGTVKIWNIDGTLQATLNGHEEAITRVDYSANGRMLASSSQDRTVKLWRIDQEQMVSSLSRHKRQVAKVLFHPFDSTTLASAGFDNQVLLWSLPDDLDLNPLEKLVDEGCQSAAQYLKSINSETKPIATDDYWKQVTEVKIFCTKKIPQIFGDE